MTNFLSCLHWTDGLKENKKAIFKEILVLLLLSPTELLAAKSAWGMGHKKLWGTQQINGKHATHQNSFKKDATLSKKC